MPEFLNPYQFIPVTDQVNGKNTPAHAFNALESTHIRHDYWDKESYSGRLVCEIKLQTPTVVGNQQTEATEHQAGTVEPYKNGQAIPANSLRGMLSSVVETLSQSALRVLNQSTYSVRKDVGNGLSALGQLKKGKGQDGFVIRPLCLPTIDLRRSSTVPEKWQRLFGENNNIAHWLPAYLNGYAHDQTHVFHSRNSFLATRPLCYHAKRHAFFYAKLCRFEQSISDPITPNPNPNLYLKNGNFLLGQKLRYNEADPIISQQQFARLPAPEQAQYTRGILHILGIDGRETEIPHTKKHEKFIPIPPCNSYGDKELDIPSEVLANFAAMTQQCAEDSKNQRPFLPQGYRQHKNEQDYWQPADGELVYFDINAEGKVTEISYSAIWRKKIKGDSYEAFATISPNLLPWGNSKRNPEHNGLTPAEALFGVVAEQKTNDRPQSYNLASRLKFTDAESLKPLALLPEQTLKILASPKPPAPSMYFKAANGAYIAKERLNLAGHKPNGRKIYLHHSPYSVTQEPWQTQHPQENLKQKLSCQPMPAGSYFYFHIDFNNLSWDELSLLTKAINPDAHFSHRLGLGKPLGLGSVKLSLCGLFFINRLQRYADLTTARYTSVYKDHQWPDDEQLNARYPLEKHYLDNPKKNLITDAFSDRLIDSETLKILCTVGNRDNQTLPVAYPYTANQTANGEQEGFKWFGANTTQTLKPATNGRLPPLKTG